MFADIHSIDPAKFKADSLRERGARERGRRHSKRSLGQDAELVGPEAREENTLLENDQNLHQLDIEA